MSVNAGRNLIAWVAVAAMAVVCGLALAQPPKAPKPIPMPGQVACTATVFFSPRGGCTDAVVREIDKANSEIKVQAYSFTSKPIADALIAAQKRGVKVDVCADDSNKNPDTSIVDELAAAGVTVRLDAKHAISHSKTMVIDGKTVLTGSFNWTAAAEKSNLENLVLIQSDVVAKQYLDNWKAHSAHAVPLEAN